MLLSTCSCRRTSRLPPLRRSLVCHLLIFLVLFSSGFPLFPLSLSTLLVFKVLWFVSLQTNELRGEHLCWGKKKWNKKLKHKHHFLPPFSFSSLPSFYFISSPFMSYVAATCPSRRPSFKHLVLNFSLRLRSKPWLCSVNTASSPYCFKVACRSLNVWRTRI